MFRKLTALLLLVGMALTACMPPDATPAVPDLDPTASRVTTSQTAAALGGSFTVSLQLYDTDGNPLRQAGQQVTFVASAGELAPASANGSAESTETVETNADGRASVTLTAESPGTITIKAYLGADASGSPVGSVSVTVTRATVELDDLTVTYDGAPKSLAPRYFPPEASIGATIAYAQDGTVLDGLPVAAGTYVVTVTPGEGYEGTAAATLTITPRDLSVTSVSWNDKQYDASRTATASSATLDTSNVIAGDDVRLGAPYAGVFDSPAVGTHTVRASFELVGDQASNYRVHPQPTGNASITAAALSISGATVAPKEYDGTTAATIVGGPSEEAVNGEEVTLVGTFASADAATDIDVTVELSGPQASNYVLDATTLTGSISPRPLELRPQALALSFGEALPASAGFTADGLVEGEGIDSAQVIVVGSSAPYAFGSHSLQVTNPVAATGTNLGNYDLSTPVVADALTVTEAQVTITPTGPFTKTYGASDPVFTYDTEGADLSTAGLVTRRAGEDVGSYEFALGDTSAWPQYRFVLADSADFTVTPAAATVMPASGQSKTYGDPEPALEFTIAGLQPGDTAAGELRRIGGEAAGEHAFDISNVTVNDGAGGANYSLTLAADAPTFLIERATLTITPDAGQAKLTGDTDPPFSYTATGFVNGDTASLLSGDLARDAGETSGVYAYHLGTLSAGSNYHLVLGGDATFAVGGVAISGGTFTYDGEPFALAATYAPAGAEVGASITYVDAAGNTLAGAPTDVGTYTVTAYAGPGYAGSATATLVIEPRKLSVTDVEFADKVYDAATGATLSATLVNDNVIPGDQVRLVERLVGSFESSQVGEHTVEGNIELTGADARNYVIDPQPQGTASITRRTLTFQGEALDKPYDGTDRAALTGSLSGLLASDQGALSISATFAQAGAGTDLPVTLELVGAAAGNYTLVDPGLTAAITPREITVTISDLPSKTYGEALALGSTIQGFTVANLAAGESIDQIDLASPGAAIKAPVGDYAVTGSAPMGEGFVPTNYAVTFESGTMAVAQRPITISATATTWTYGEEPAPGDLAPEILSGSLPAFAELSGELTRGDLNVGEGAAFEPGTFDILDADTDASVFENFDVTYGAYEVTPRAATVSVTYSPEKTYGDPIDLTYVDSVYFTTSGLAAGESIDQVLLSSAAFAARTAVGDHEVTASEPTGTGFDAANYDLTFEPGTVTIVGRVITITGSFSVAQRPYDGDDGAPIADGRDLQLVNVVEGDDVTLAPAASYDGDVTVGADKAVILTDESALYGADAGNYTLSLAGAPTSTGTVVKALVEFDVTIAGTGGAKSVVYDGGTTFQPNVTTRNLEPKPENQPVAFIVDIRYNADGTSRGSFRDVGTYTVTVTADDPRYEGVSVHDDLEVLAREITIASTTNTKTYGDANPDLTPSISDASALGLGAGDTFELDTQLAFAGSDDQYLNVGEYALELGDVIIRRGGANVTRNYDITFASDFSITPAVLTIAPTADQAKVYGEPDPVFGFLATGFVGTDDDQLIEGALVRAEGESVGSYAFALDGISAGGNYRLELVSDAAEFAVTPRHLTLSAMTTRVVYGETGHDLTALITDGTLREGDTLAGSLSMPLTDVGTAEFTAGEDLAVRRDEQDVTANYSLSFATYDVTPRAATVVPAAEQSKIYGENDPELAYTVEHLLEGDELTGALARAEGEDVGSYAFELGTLANANYALSLPEEAATFTITPRAVVLGATVASKEYGDDDPDLTPILLNDSTLRAGDSLAGSLAHAGVDANADYPLAIGTVQVLRHDVDVTANYDVSFGTFTINPKPVSFDITNSDFLIGTGAGRTHAFLGDGTSEIRGLEVTSTPVSVESFRFTYRRTHDQDNTPIPSGQQTVQNINRLGSYVVTVTATDPNYTGVSPLNVWVTDATEIVFTATPADETILGFDATMTVELRNAAGEPRPAGPAGLPIALTADGADVAFRDAGDTTDITAILIAAGESSATALIRPLAAGTVTITAAPPAAALAGFEALTLNFSATEPALTANADGPYDVVAGGTLQIPVSELLANDDWTGASDWGFGGVLGFTGVEATIAGDNVVVAAAVGTGNTTGTVTYQITSEGEFGKSATATITINVTLPPVDALLYTNRAEIDAFMGSVYELPTFATVFQSWPRFENNQYHTAPNGTGDTWTGNLSHWSYNPEQERIEYGVNNEQHIGIVSDEAFDYFEFEATLQSTHSDDDSIGLVIAFVRDGGVNKALIAHRTHGGNDPRSGWGISYLEGSTLTVLTNESVGGTLSGWSGRSSRVRIDRTGDTIRASATPWNIFTDFQQEMLIDLDASTINGTPTGFNLSVFKGKQQYGYYVRSQQQTTYLDIDFQGGVARDTAILLTNEVAGEWTGSEVYRFDTEAGWNQVIGATIQSELDHPRTVTSVAEDSSVAGDSFRIYQNHVEPLTTRD